MTFDTLIINGQIIDGTGKKGYHADVGIQGEQIVAIERSRNRGMQRAQSTRLDMLFVLVLLTYIHTPI